MIKDSEQVFVQMNSHADTVVAVDVLSSAGYKVLGFESLEKLCDGVRDGCGLLILAGEVLHGDRSSLLHETLKSQEPWSDLPLILVSASAESGANRFGGSGNVTVLVKPLARSTLINAVETALRARKRQYNARQIIEDQRRAAVQRDEFFATLSHELRTPLNVILGWTEILMSGDLSPEEQLSALKTLDRNARVQKSLIDDLLDTSRIITGKLFLELKVVSLTSLVKTVVTEYSPRAKEKKIELIAEIPDSDCHVMADDLRISQVFTNLITNAIKFTPAGGRIAVKLTCGSPSHEICVSDTGQGMDAGFLPFVFDRLKQEDMSTTRTHGGLGLGLAITAHIIEQHQGKISVFSEGKGKGSTFTVSIPAVKKEQRMDKPSVAIEGGNKFEGLKVLVVDDSADIRELIRLWLLKTGAVVRFAECAVEALKIIPEFRPQILLSDVGMPQMDGYEFIKAVRELGDKKLAIIPAAALTAYAKDEERTAAIESGFQLHLAKPISREDLLSVVRSLAKSANEIQAH